MPTDDTFVGRADELALLNAEMQRVTSGEPRLVWLTGEAGIGKTSLVRRFVGGLSGVQVLWAGGDENETDLPYGVVNQLLSVFQRASRAPLWRHYVPMPIRSRWVRTCCPSWGRCRPRAPYWS